MERFLITTESYIYAKDEKAAKSLAGYVQGELSHAIEVGNQIRAGQITINGGARGNAAPFGGYKASGNGREHGKHGIEECLETKAIIIPAS